MTDTSSTSVARWCSSSCGNAIGDETFFSMVKDGQPRTGTGAPISRLHSLLPGAERDEDLTDLFDDWLFRQGRPDWEY